MADDCDRFERGRPVSPVVLQKAPLLEDWVPAITPQGVQLIGHVTGHPLLGDCAAATTPLWLADPDGTWARSLSRFYRLGPPLDRDGKVELESMLRSRFPRDLIEPVAKGEFGGDVVHRVLGPGGQACGTILWESKRTRNWNDGWLAKLRDDQRTAKAEVALIVSTALPRGIETFDLVDNVWVTEPRFAIPLAIALRQSLIDVTASRQAQEGQQTKMDMVYAYLTGPRFRHRIDAIVERFTDMQADLDRERKMMTRLPGNVLLAFSVDGQ